MLTPEGVPVRVVFDELVGDFVRDHSGKWIFLQIKAFRLTSDSYARAVAAMEKENDAAVGLGDFDTFRKQASMRAVQRNPTSPGLSFSPSMPSHHDHHNSPMKNSIEKVGKQSLQSRQFAARRLADEGKVCAFCGVKHITEDIPPFVDSGSSPKSSNRSTTGMPIYTAHGLQLWVSNDREDDGRDCVCAHVQRREAILLLVRRVEMAAAKRLAAEGVLNIANDKLRESEPRESQVENGHSANQRW